jgi:protoporphyrinogen oxidase
MVPKFPVGQARRLEAFRRQLRPNAIDLAGDYLGGPWTEAALASGEDAAGRLQAYLEDSRRGEPCSNQ